MTNGDNWVEKHRPETFDDIQGNTSALKKIKSWIDNWERGDNAILLHGPRGTGKTTTAFVVADYLDAPITQINASDARKKEDIENMADEATMTPIDHDLQVVFLDEIDSWPSSATPAPLADVLDDPPNPIIMSCNEEWQMPNSIRYHSNIDKYKFKLNISSRRAKIREIAKREGMDIEDDDLEMLAKRGDLRSAINDLQLLAAGGSIEEDGRDWAIDEWKAMEELLLGDGTPSRRLDPKDFVLWVDENLSDEYRGLEACLAYELLAEADISLGRIWAQGKPDYRYMKFAGELTAMTADMRMTDTPKRHWLDINFPEWFRAKKPKNEYPNEHVLFEQLKDAEEGSYQFAGNFTYFRRVILPILLEMPREERCQLAISAGLYEITDDDTNRDPLSALDVTKAQFEDWVEEEAPEVGEWEPPSKDAMAW